MSSCACEICASPTLKRCQQQGCDSHTETPSRSFQHGSLQNHLFCWIPSAAPWLGTPGWRRDQKGRCNGKTGALGGASWLNFDPKNVEALKGGNPYPTQLSDSLKSAGYTAVQHLNRTEKKKDRYCLFPSHGSLKLMQECLWWTCAKCVQPMWHPTCTQQLVEIHGIIQFRSNLLGLLIRFRWVPSIHASTNMIPTSFVSRCRRSVSVEHFRCMHLQGASFRQAA